MGRLKGGANTAEECEGLSLPELEKLIVHADWRYNHAGLNSAMRKDAFSRLIWLEAERERLHAIAAPNSATPASKFKLGHYRISFRLIFLINWCMRFAIMERCTRRPKATGFFVGRIFPVPSSHQIYDALRERAHKSALAKVQFASGAIGPTTDTGEH